MTTATGWVHDDVRASIEIRAARDAAKRAKDAEASAIAVVVERDGELDRQADALEAACRAVVDAYDAAGGPVPLRVTRAGVNLVVRTDSMSPGSASFRPGPDGIAVTIAGRSRGWSDSYNWTLVDGELRAVLPGGPADAARVVEAVLRPLMRAALIA